MEYSTGKRIGASLLVLLHVWSMPVLAATSVCTTSSSLGSVFSVLDNGTITISGDTGSGGKCNVIFMSTSTVNSATVTQPGQGGTTGECAAYTTSSSSTHLSASGSTVSARTLSTYSESTSTTTVYMSVNGLQINGTTVQFNSDGSVSSGTTLAVKKVGNGYVLPGGDYASIEWQNLNSQVSGITFTGPIRTKYLGGGSCNNLSSDYTGVTFAQDDTTASDDSKKYNYIDYLNLSDQCGVKVAGPNKTTLNILGIDTLGKAKTAGTTVGLTIPSSGTCINYDYASCNAINQNHQNMTMDQLWSNMNAQHPELLQINIYNGDYTASDHSCIAAGVYVPNGSAILNDASMMVFVGELLAKNITVSQNNSGVYFFSKSTASATLTAGSYSLTPPASDPVITGGSYIYRAMQRDYLSDNTTAGTSGHLMKFALNDDTTQKSTAEWDAAALMTTTIRQSKIYTEDANGNFILLQNAPASTLTDGTQTATVTCIINPDCNNGASLAGRDASSLVGTPWRTYPILIGDSQLASNGSANAAYKGGSVLFATDDGILYSVDRDTGALNWGWIPAKIVPMTATPANLILKHPWGQISSMSLYKTGSDGKLAEHTYVTGTALGGQLHFAIEVDNYGKSLKSVVWQDYRSGQYSPGSDAWGGIAGRPYGGAAPTAQIGGTGKVAYAVNNQIVTRQIDDSTTAATTSSLAWYSSDRTSGAPVWDDSTIKVSSNLIYMGDSAIYFGGSNGRVWQTTSAGHLKSGAVNIDLSLDGKEAITFLNGATINSTSGNSLILLAQSTSRVTTLKYLNGAWTYNWYTSVGVSSPTTVAYIPSGSNAYISAPSDISDGAVYLYYTTKDSSGCSVKGYEFGPISLLDGTSMLSSVKVGASSSLSSYIGPGEAVGGIVAEWYSSTAKKLYDGVLAATAGTPGGSGSSSSSSSGSTSSTASLSTDAQTLFLGQQQATTTTRVNWRELTNFF